MKRQNVRTLSLIICTLTYLFIGAAVFDALESDNEMQQRALVSKVRNRLMAKYNISETDYEILESIIIRSIPHKAGHQWKFSGAFYFATTVITTIGYGHSTPLTIAGKIFCMFYALAGIPLGLVMFQSIGERLNTFAALTLTVFKHCIGKSPEVTHVDLIFVASGCSTFLITFGAYVFHRYEKWSYFDSVYYCFTTLTTIGFGDFVALQKDGALQRNPEYVAFSLIFILFGLTFISAAMNLLVLRFLTMNTEDEKRDKQEARLAAKGFIRVKRLSEKIKSKAYSSSNVLPYDINANLNAKVSANDIDDNGMAKNDDTGETASACSCSCYQLAHSDTSRRRRYSVRNRRVNSIAHLVHFASDSSSSSSLSASPSMQPYHRHNSLRKKNNDICEKARR